MNTRQTFSSKTGVTNIVCGLVCCFLPCLVLPLRALAGQTITIQNLTIVNNVSGSGAAPYGEYGGNYDYGDFPNSATDNSVTVDSGGVVTGNVDGGDASGASGEAATASDNSVTVRNGGYVAGAAWGAYAYSESGGATASNNSVTISAGSQVDSGAIGGYAESYGVATTATASNNSVTISAGALVAGGGGYGAIGGYAYSDSGSATASNNSVTINGGALVGSYGIIGGVASGYDSATASNNSVTINGGMVSGAIIGGWASGSGSATATYNTVTISGTADLTSVGLIGGYGGSGGGNDDLFTGNTLNVWNYHETSPVYSVQNFQFFNFLFPVPQDDAPVLSVIGAAILGDGNGKGSTVTAINTTGGTPLAIGGSVTLIQAGILDTDGFNQTQVQGQHGATVDYTWALSWDDTTLTATVNNVQADPKTKALSEGNLSGLALNNQGADLVAGKGVGQAVAASQETGSGSFAAVAGGWSRYDTGSHVDMSSVNLIAGLSVSPNLYLGRLTLGAFVEWGDGSYNTYNSFAHAADVNGDGTAWYLGGGILGRLDFVDVGPGNFYAEASFRSGNLHNDYQGGDLRDATGRSATGYDASFPYYGVHVGVGYIWKPTKQIFLDLYGKDFWTRQQGGDVVLSTNDPVKFDDAYSHRLRLGGRFTYAINTYVSPYIGAAWEHEFDGKVKASTYGYAIDSPSLGGDTGIGEIGLTMKPNRNMALAIDLGVQGYISERQGVTGSGQIRYDF